jgi:hypothetical protein
LSKRYANNCIEKSTEEAEVISLVHFKCFLCDHTLPKRYAIAEVSFTIELAIVFTFAYSGCIVSSARQVAIHHRRSNLQQASPKKTVPIFIAKKTKSTICGGGIPFAITHGG